MASSSFARFASFARLWAVLFPATRSKPEPYCCRNLRCQADDPIYSRAVKWNWKRMSLGGALLATVLSSAGCSGIHASKGVSPATFLLPGLMKNDAPVPADSFPAVPLEPILAQLN